MSTTLAKVAKDPLTEPRGPDVVHSIRIPAAWLISGETIELELPRQLNCAHCQGGGCDQCQRAGALRLRQQDEPPETVRVSLPDTRGLDESQADKPLLVRIPHAGGHAATENLPRGVLMLQISRAADADLAVRLVPSDAERELRAPREVVVRSMVLGGLLVLVFLWMLYLSGWL
ncbi:MAG TPA: hypothetical protein VI197_25965 [Polyangiaceae bacterium]